MNTPDQHSQKQYIKVISEFDVTGYMQPRSIIWENGQVYPIDIVTDYRPAKDLGLSLNCDCFVVIIKGRSLPLFFERTNPSFRSVVGRWFILRRRPAEG